MQEFCAAALPVRQDGNVWQVGLFGGAWQTVWTADGKLPVEMPPGFAPTTCLDFWGDGHLLLLANQHGGKTTWVLDEAFRTLCDLSDPALDSMPSVRQVLAGPAIALRRSLRMCLAYPSGSVTGVALRAMRPDAVARFVTMAQGRARSLPASALDETGSAPYLGSAPVQPGALARLLDMPAGWGGPAAVARLGGFPALGVDGMVESAFLVGRNSWLPMVRCVEQQGRLLYYVLFREDASPALYVPSDNVFVSRDVLDAAVARSLLAALDTSLAALASALAAADAGQVPDHASGLGLVIPGIYGASNPRKHLVEEVDALASFLANLPPDRPGPTLCLVAPASGLDSAWPLEELFPELEGRVARAPTETAALAQAITSGTPVLLHGGLPSSPAARDRIKAAVNRAAVRTGLADQVQAACTRDGGQPGIVVALGLSPSNGLVADLLGFYSRLAKTLAERFGRIVLLLDGGSSDEVTDAAPGASGGAAAIDGGGWAAAFRTALGSLDAELVDLTGMPVRDGLCWLQNTTFFVAPLGKGLARLRWMLDIPGLVLLEETGTMAGEDALHLYRSEAALGGPVSPLHTGRMDRTRLTRDVQRGTGRKGRAQPKAPVLHEDGLIQRISDLVAAQSSRDGQAPLPEPKAAPPRAPRRLLGTLFGRRQRGAPRVAAPAAAGTLPLAHLSPALATVPQGPGLRCIDIVKDYPVHHGRRRVLDHVNLDLARGQKLGILGRNGAGKSTLIRIIGGVDVPTAGRVIRDMSVSWPLGFSGAFQGSLSGIDNLRFICRIYGLDYDDTRLFVDDFAELGSQLGEPVKTYSSGMRARLAFALSIAIEFECYLIDEVIMVGDKRFTDRCRRELFEKRADRSLILVSHDMNIIRSVCDTGAVLHERQLHVCDSIADAVSFYEGM